MWKEKGNKLVDGEKESSRGVDNRSGSVFPGGRRCSNLRYAGYKRKWELIVIMLSVMSKAMFVGVPRTLNNMPLLWLPIRREIQSNGEELLNYVERIVPHLLATTVFRIIPVFKTRQCLAKALTMAWYAKKFRFPIVLHFGVNIVEDRLKGHCWVSSHCVEEFGNETNNCEGYKEIWKWQGNNTC